LLGEQGCLRWNKEYESDIQFQPANGQKSKRSQTEKNDILKNKNGLFKEKRSWTKNFKY
tara:strand:- start:402 stop:578 length:177 start_codon:yes stop_codon:yes gene_type:complete